MLEAALAACRPCPQMYHRYGQLPLSPCAASNDVISNSGWLSSSCSVKRSEAPPGLPSVCTSDLCLQELERKLVKLAKAMDHLERARREEEAPLVAQSAQARIVSSFHELYLLCARWMSQCAACLLSVGCNQAQLSCLQLGLLSPT